MGTLTVTNRLVRGLLKLASGSTCLLNMELRHCSRKWSTYALRIGFVLGLAVFTVLVWMTQVENASGPVGIGGISRMPEAGKRIIVDVLWLEFFLGQLAAIVLLCPALRQEMHLGRLSALMTTPMNYTQMVAGKFFSRLIQLTAIMLAALPVLALVRVFGGVPWDFVVAGMLACFMAALVAGISAMRLALRLHPLTAMLWTVVIVIPLNAPLGIWLAYASNSMLAGGGVSGHVYTIMLAVYLPACAVGMLTCLGAFQSAAAKALGNDGIRRRPSSRDLQAPTAPGLIETMAGQYQPGLADEPFSPVTGSPIVWRATRRRILSMKVTLMLTALLSAYGYLFLATTGWLKWPGLQGSIIQAMLLIGLLVLGGLAAASITVDKQAGYWQLLLISPLGDADILRAKLVAIGMRLLPLGGLVVLHVVILAVVGVVTPLSGAGIVLVVACSGAFMVGLGMYFSSRFPTTTVSVLMTAGAAVAIWLLVPGVCMLAGQIVMKYSLSPNWFVQWCRDGSAISPFAQIRWLVTGTGSAAMPQAGVVGSVLECSLVYAVAGASLLWMAMRNFRRYWL